MPHHTSAFTASIAQLTNSDIPALTDDILTIANGHFQPQMNMQLIYFYLGGPNMDRGRINSPSNRQVTIPFIRPINVASLPATDPNVADYTDNPFVLRGLEEVALEVTTNAIGPSRIMGVMGLSNGFQAAPRGDVFTLRGTSTTAAVAFAWTTITTTWADLLAQGNYAVVGLEVFSANAIAARLIFPTQQERPGGISIGALGNRTHRMFRKGGLGVWGRFNSTAVPVVQVLALAADAVHEVYLDIVRTA